MKTRSLRAAVALSAALTAALTPIAASAQTTYEFKRAVPGLKGGGTLPAPGNPGTPSAPTGTPVLGLSTQAVDFGNVATNTTEKRQVVVSNTGDGTLSITRAATVSGAVEFAAGLTTCGSTLGAGAECLLEPTFSPTSVGTFNGVLTFTTALAGSPHDITLVGTAFNPVSLASALLPAATRNKPYLGFDFKTLLAVSNEATPVKSQATWGILSGGLPPGLSLDAATGVLTGTPTQATAAGGQEFTVVGTYRGNQSHQSYTVVVENSSLQVWQPAAGVIIDANGDVSVGISTAARTTAALPTSGKWYWELHVLSEATSSSFAELPVVGVSTTTNGYPGRYANGCGHFAYGTLNFIEDNGVERSAPSSSRSWVLGVGYDGSTRTTTFYRGGTTLGSCVVGGVAPAYLTVGSGGSSTRTQYRLIGAPANVPAGFTVLDQAPSE